MSAWGKQIGLGIALVLSVALVTLLFSFLGTIACAALVGMMAGATRQWRWQIILASLVFPAVITAFTHFTKTNLTSQQNLVLPLVCFGAFWLTYFLTCALAYFEKKDDPSAEPAIKPAGRTEASQFLSTAKTQVEDNVITAPLAVRTAPSLETDLAELQGTWAWESPAVNGHFCKKIIEVACDKLDLRIVGVDGQARVLCHGDVKLEGLGPFKILTVVNLRANPSVICAERSELPGKWIYRIAGKRLFLASNLDARANGQESTIETYIKL